MKVGVVQIMLRVDKVVVQERIVEGGHVIRERRSQKSVVEVQREGKRGSWMKFDFWAGRGLFADLLNLRLD